ncbi:hypothetical protein C808_02270 [Lachnospiraceae bacterium M18-1]|nr:hypothetical protein C808_02270 [Lachnospiraceae bacterium M18-1]
MNRKLHRVLDEIQKTEEKIAVWQEHLGELNVQKEMLEDAEIIKSIRSMRLGSRELLEVLEGVQAGTILLSNHETEEEPEQNESREFMEPEHTENDGTAELAAGNGMPQGMESEREDLENEREN